MIKYGDKAERTTISAKLKTDLTERLEEISKEHGIPVNRLIEVSLERYLAQTWIAPEEKNKGI